MFNTFHKTTIGSMHSRVAREIWRRVSVIVCLLLFVAIQNVSAQQLIEKKVLKEVLKREQMHIRYRVSKSYIDPHYMNNADSLKRIVEWVDGVQKDSMVDIVSVEFCGAVSPEGSVRFNHYLSKARLNTLEKYVRNKIYIPEEIIVRNDHYIAWNELEAMVEKSNLANKDEILVILRSENRSVGEELDSRIGDLKKMDNGVTWLKLYNMFFADMRNAYTVIVTKKSQFAIEYEQRLVDRTITPAALPMPKLSIASLPPMPAPQIGLKSELEMRYMYVKSNLAGLALLMGNLGVEFDMGRYWSFNLPIYYSALNYFRHTVKFRTFAVQPELRFWPMTNHDKLFIGAHMGFAYYNFAFNGDWRYQDRDGQNPTLGGGLSLGYRMPISRNDRWKLEFALGVGIYPLDYDVFHNEYNGPLYDSRKKTYIGLDNALVGISYRIPFKKVYPKR